MSTQTTEQPGLFAEPAHIETRPTEPRWTVLEPDGEDEDLDDADDDETLIAIDTGDDLEQLRDFYDDYDAWLQDNLTGRLFEPCDWPDDDSVDHAALHVINTLSANDYLAALADYQHKHTPAPVKP